MRRRLAGRAALAVTLLGLAAAATAAEAGGPAGLPLPPSLTGVPGSPERGRAIVGNRQRGMCLLCHRVPLPEERFQGDLGPDLAGVGGRLSEGELRLRLVDPARINPATIMPAFARVEGLVRVAPAQRGKPLLDAAEIEDVVAFLAGLRE